MSGPASPVPAPQRRLTLTPIAFDILLALDQSRNTIRLADLANLIGSPVSSVQASLRILMANDIVERIAGDPPVYRLRHDHPAAAALVNVASVLPEPEHVIGIALRANPAVAFATIDGDGFVYALLDDASRDDLGALGRLLETVRAARTDGPRCVQLGAAELGRLARVDVGLWRRISDAVRLKGRLPNVRHAQTGG